MDTSSILASVTANPNLANDPMTIAAYQKAGGTLTNGSIPVTQAQTNQSSTPNPLIVTSGASRTQYATNVSNMNGAISNITPQTPPSTPTTPSGGDTPTDSTTQQARLSGGTYQGMDGKTYYKYDGSTADNAPAPAGSSTPDSTDPNSPANIDTKGLDPILSKQYTDAIQTANDNLKQRQSDLDAAKATVQNDPAAGAALDSIKKQYDVLITAMQAKNKMVLGSYQANAARSGALQFANGMTTDFMSEEMDKANGRVSDLIAKENDLLMKTTIAYKTGDVKALNAAQSAYDKANTDKLKAIGDLVTATNKQVKEVQAQQKLDQATLKATNAQDIANSTKGAVGGLSLLKSTYGIDDPSKASADQISSIAQAYGVSNPSMMLSQLTAAYNTQKKNDLGEKNIQSQIDTRKQNADTAAKKASTAKAKPKGTAAERAATTYANINQLLATKDKTGMPYIEQDTTKENGGNGYFTVGGFQALVKASKEDGISRANFLKEYGSYLSPDNLGNYGLTKAEIDALKNIGKTSAVNATS